MENGREIFVKYGERVALMKIFGKSHVTIKRALRGETNSKLAQKIRQVAIERGGVESQAKF